MTRVNAAGTPEYQKLREAYIRFYGTSPQTFEKKVVIGRKSQLAAEIFDCSGKEVLPDGTEELYKVKKVVISSSDRPIYEYTAYYECPSHMLLNLISHANGREYLIFNRELYGYSVLDIQSLQTVDFIPAEMLEGKEAFIGTGTIYCPHTNVLAVNGCYWACPWYVEFYDLSDPMSVPLPFLGDTYEYTVKKYGNNPVNTEIHSRRRVDNKCRRTDQTVCQRAN